MKKLFTLFCFSVVLAFNSQAQAPKNALFEHFTNTDCAPCAAQNPVFEANILKTNPRKVYHIAYHSSFPGPTDPFYLYAQASNLARQQYYVVQGVPNMILNGNFKSQSPAVYTQADVDTVTNLQTSPVTVAVNMTGTATRNVQVVVKSVGAIPAGNYVVLTAVIEREKNFTAAPGSNGEKAFVNLFRKMLPDASGSSIALNAINQEFTLNYTFNEDAVMNSAKLEVIAFVQNVDTKEVLNCNATFSANGNITPGPKLVLGGTPATPGSINMTVSNGGTASETFRIELTSTQPTDWAAALKVNGQIKVGADTLVLASGQTQVVEIAVTPGTSAAVGTYLLKMNSISQPNASVIEKTAYVISNVTDLIVNNSAKTAAGPIPFPAGWQNIFNDAFVAAGSTKHAGADEKLFTQAVLDNALGQIKHVYFNVGWTFPAITTELAAKFSTFCDNGGNFFVSGQDVAWAAFSPTAGTVANDYYSEPAQDFIKNYLGADYVDDGVSSDNKWIAETTDGLYNGFGTSTITNFYTGTNFFPDNLTAYGTGKIIARYVANNASKVAGVRNSNGTWKTVYFAPGVEMLNTIKRKDMLKLTYQWFHGIVSNDEIDARFQQIGRCYPNPANGFTMVPVINVKNNLTLQVNDASGKLIKSVTVPANSEEFRLDTRDLQTGTYFYQLSDGSKLIDTQALNIVK